MFKPFKVKGVKFRNRILAPPTVNDHANVEGKVTPALIKHYRTLARQGVGTIIVESAYVIKQGRSHINQLGISEEEHLEGLEQLVRGVKKEGASIGIRISHAGAQTSENACGEQPVGPSVLNFGRDYDISREFDQGDVAEIVLSFVHAAERADARGQLPLQRVLGGLWGARTPVGALPRQVAQHGQQRQHAGCGNGQATICGLLAAKVQEQAGEHIGPLLCRLCGQCRH